MAVDPISSSGNAGSLARHNLLLRVASALVLAPLALAAAYGGGWLFIGFWFAAAAAVLWEWIVLVTGAANLLAFMFGSAALSIAALMTALDRPVSAALVVALGALGAGIFAPTERRVAIMGGAVYSGVMLIAPVLLRAHGSLGFMAIGFLFGIVWTTDVLGYFVGRALGGPKLAPAISPKKTWSGAVAGAVGAALISAVLSDYIPGTNRFPMVFIGILFSVAAQVGDLLESWLKRRFGVKDTSQLIPGHGGVMDRLDGFWAAALLGLIVGLAREGIDAPAQGLLVW